MDSVTQLLLGAAVGEAALGRKVGHKAIAWGAVCGTLPDLDVFIPLGDAVRDFTYHRGPSHSLFVLAALTPLIVWLIRKLHPGAAAHRTGWYALVYLVFATHVLLDSFTVYGTQIFWPLVSTPMTWSTIFIIDPAYTVPLLLGVTAALAARRQAWGYRANAAGLALSSLYLAWSLGAKLYVEDVARDALAGQGIEAERLLTTPTPFNTVLWRAVAVAADGDYYEGYYSLFDRGAPIPWQQHDSAPELLAGIADEWAVQRLQWFTKGFYRVDREGDAIVITDLRMGLEPDYAFSFKVGEISNPHAVAEHPPQRVRRERPLEAVRWVWTRIWQPEPSAWAEVRSGTG